MIQLLWLCGHEMKDDARKAPGESIDSGRNKARGQKWGASDPHFSSRRVGEKFDILHAPAQVIEYGHSTIEQRATILGRLDPLPVAIEQAHTERMFQLRD